MNNCSKCQKQIYDTEHYLYNTFCRDCWPTITLDERKSLPGFCKVCGEGWNHLRTDGTMSCLNCFRQTNGKGTFPND